MGPYMCRVFVVTCCYFVTHSLHYVLDIFFGGELACPCLEQKSWKPCSSVALHFHQMALSGKTAEKYKNRHWKSEIKCQQNGPRITKNHQTNVNK